MLPGDSSKLIELTLSGSDAAKNALTLLGSPRQIQFLISERPNQDYVANLKFDSPEWPSMVSSRKKYVAALLVCIGSSLLCGKP